MASIREPRDQGTDTAAAPQWLMDAAVARIHEGALPHEMQSRVMAGPGRKQRCCLCGHSIETGDVGYAVDPAPGASLHFHVCCYHAWVKACQAMPRGWRRTASPATHPDRKRSGP